MVTVYCGSLATSDNLGAARMHCLCKPALKTVQKLCRVKSIKQQQEAFLCLLSYGCLLWHKCLEHSRCNVRTLSCKNNSSSQVPVLTNVGQLWFRKVQRDPALSRAKARYFSKAIFAKPSWINEWKNHPTRKSSSFDGIKKIVTLFFLRSCKQGQFFSSIFWNLSTSGTRTKYSENRSDFLSITMGSRQQ